jgi:hypothetical protein
MSRNCVRTVLCVLVVLCVLAAAPLEAKPVRVAAKGTPALSFEAFTALWERAARLLMGSVPVEKEGTSIDPDGAKLPVPAVGTTEEGTSIDPNGRP